MAETTTAPVATADGIPQVAAKPSLQGFTGKRKSAILLVSMGSDYAAKIYKHLKPEEIEQLTLEIATLPNVESEITNDVLGEFYEMCLAQKFIVEGGLDYAKEILEKAFGLSNADEIIDKVTSSLGNKDFDFMKKVDPKQLYNFIQHEYPQTIALILAYATKSQASAIINMLPANKQSDVIKRIAKMDRASPEVVKEVEESLKLRLSTLKTKDITDLGGVKYTAELLNSVDRATEKLIFDELGKDDPDLAAEIRKLMFVFEDIMLLDDTAMQILVRDVDIKDLVVALKNTTEEIQNSFFRNMSKRSSEMIKEDMQYAKVRPREVEAAQTRIVNKIRELDESGQIVIARGEGDALV